MLIPSYTAAALAKWCGRPRTLAGASALAASLKRPRTRQGQWTRVTPTTRVPKTTLTAAATPSEGGPSSSARRRAGAGSWLLTTAPVPPFGRSDGARSVGGVPGWTRRPPPSPSRLCVRRLEAFERGRRLCGPWRAPAPVDRVVSLLPSLQGGGGGRSRDRTLAALSTAHVDNLRRTHLPFPKEADVERAVSGRPGRGPRNGRVWEPTGGRRPRLARVLAVF